MNVKYLGFVFLLYITPVTAQTQRGGLVVSNPEDSIRNNFALVVGISDYANINHLLYADDDAYLMANYLLNEQICKRENLVMLVDTAATKANFYKELRRLMNKAKEKDRVFIYFAGHGDVETDIESGFLLCYNSEPSNYPATDAIDISMLERFVNALVKQNVKVVLITDACRSGNLAGGLTGASNTMSSISKGFQNVIKMLSCQPNQLSEEKMYAGGGHGVFTYNLVQGLNGLADKDGDGFISLRELDIYLDVVSQEAKQNPKLDGDPQAKVVKYDEALKLVAMNTKGPGPAKGPSAKNKRGLPDSTWLSNSYFRNFNEQLRTKRYIQPDSSNAFLTISEATRNKENPDMIEDMKLELSAVLEDESQKFINKYLRGDLEKNRVDRTELKRCNDYLQAIGKLMDKDDIRYDEIEVRRTFFEALLIYNQDETGKFKYAVDQLEKANAKLPNQSWILAIQGQLYGKLKNGDMALKRLKQAIALSPNWVYAWNDLGIAYWDQKNYEEAEKAYTRAISLDSSVSFPWNNLGLLYQDRKQYDKAEQFYAKSLSIDSSDAVGWNNIGTLYFAQKKYNEADGAYRKAVKLSPYYILPRNNLGLMYYTLKNYSLAEKIYRQNITIDSNNVDTWIKLGNLYKETKKYVDAEQAYKRCLSLDSLNSSSWNNLGLVYYNQKLYAKAEPYFQRALVIDSNYSAALTNLGLVYYYQKMYTKAELNYRRAISKDTANANAWNNLGVMYNSQKKYKDAESAYLKAVSIDTSYASAWNNLGLLYYNQKLYPKAEQDYQRALSIDTAYALAWNNLGNLYKDQGKYNDAEAKYKTAISRDSTYSDAWNNLGLVYYYQNDYPKALAAYTKALSLDSANATAWNRLGLVYFKQKSLQNAEWAYRRAVSYDSTYSTAWNNLANLYKDQQKYENASMAYKKNASLDSTNTETWNNLGLMYYYQQKYPQAESAYRRALSLDSTNVTVWNRLGLVYYYQEAFGKAESAYKRAVTYDTAYATAWSNLGANYFRQKQYEKAQASYEKAVLLDNFNADYWIRLSDAIDSAKNNTNFPAWYAAHKSLFKDNQYVHTQLGYYYLHLKEKDFGNAEIQFMTANNFSKDDPFTNYDLACLYSIWEKKDASLKYLELALKNGFKNFAHIAKDTDMDNMRNTEEFKALITKYQDSGK